MVDRELQAHFADRSSMEQAHAILKELGYEPYQSKTGPFQLCVPTDRQDEQSAVEIVQAYGGSAAFADTTEGPSMFQEISIPAHLVNEDWEEAYATGQNNRYTGDALQNRDEDPPFDDAVDGFSGSVKA
ncbi:hypothetical protein [Paenibacillus sp. JJ-223]|uniref:hypothetical protein n=1 Tax=Paenibacillus sp. JJ-223 TaxID=2905647 RepID=UPI001F3EA444|nr:hypothetical protein [Paenibacillus sp. JJ-223]CAH1222898.1 hypothetical protein PAECIP111890_05440 [Paenibacillus sp. JJ-223]